MNTRRRAPALAAIAALVGIAALGAPLAASADPADPTAFTVTGAAVDSQLTTAFGEYGDTAGRWTGADSAYSVPLPDGRTAWLYSDTFMGTVNPDHSRPLDSVFVHNSIIVDAAGTKTTVTGGTEALPESLVKVEGGAEDADWYWFGDGTVEGNSLRVMLLRFIKTGTGVFDFEFAGSAIASFDLPNLTLQSITAGPSSPIHWGSAILEESDYTYVYGVEDRQAQKWAHLARVPAGQLTQTATWQYWDGTGWDATPTTSARVLEGVSNEFSVTPFLGGYALVTGDAREPLSASIVAYQSTSPTGPFTVPTELYRTPQTSGNVFTYNAKAHPNLGDDRTLLITYNVNSFDTQDVYTNVDNYRPQYVAVTVATDPQLTVSVAPSGPLVVGKTVTYTVTVSNAAGSLSATEASATATLPANLRFESATGGGTYDAVSGSVTWPAQDVVAGQSVSYTLTAMVLAGETSATVSASVAAANACFAGCGAQVSSDVSVEIPDPTTDPTVDPTANPTTAPSVNPTTTPTAFVAPALAATGSSSTGGLSVGLATAVAGLVLLTLAAVARRRAHASGVTGE